MGAGDGTEGALHVSVVGGRQRPAVDPDELAGGIEQLQVATDRGGADTEGAHEIVDRRDAVHLQPLDDLEMPMLSHTQKPNSQ